MSFTPIEPYRYTANARGLRPPCTASISLGRESRRSPATQRMRLQIMFRTAQIPEPPAWLRADASCTALTGWDEDHGSVRIMAGELFKVAVLGGRAPTGALRIIMPLPATLIAKARSPITVEMRRTGEAIDVVFPVEWRADVATLKAARAASATVMKAGGKGLFR